MIRSNLNCSRPSFQRPLCSIEIGSAAPLPQMFRYTQHLLYSQTSGSLGRCLSGTMNALCTRQRESLLRMSCSLTDASTVMKHGSHLRMSKIAVGDIAICVLTAQIPHAHVACVSGCCMMKPSTSRRWHPMTAGRQACLSLKIAPCDRQIKF